jgi:hypothetical protein
MPDCIFCGKITSTDKGLKRHITGQPECRREWKLMIENLEVDDLDIPEDIVPHHVCAHSAP